MQESISPKPDSPKPSRKKKWLRRVAALFLLLVVALVWFDGPGCRWLLPKAAAFFAKKQGIEIRFTLLGRITNGLVIRDISASGGPIDDLAIGEIRPRYEFLRAIRGEVGGVEVRGVAGNVDLDKTFAWHQEKPDEPLDLAKLIANLRTQQQNVQKWYLHLDAGKIILHRSGVPFLRIESLEIQHEEKSAAWRLTTAGMRWQSEDLIPQQQANMLWTQEAIEVDRLQFSRESVLQSLRVATPQDARLSISAEAIVAKSRWDFVASPGLGEVTLGMSDGEISAADVTRISNIALPAAMVLDGFQFRATLRGLPWEDTAETEAFRADFAADLQCKDLVYDQYRVDNLTWHVEKKGTAFLSKMKANGYGGEIAFDADGLWDQEPAKVEDLTKMSVNGAIAIPETSEILLQTRPLWDASKGISKEKPSSAGLNINAKARIDGKTQSAIEAEITLDHKQQNHPDINLVLQSPDADAWNVTLKSPDLEASGTYQIAKRNYSAQASLRQWNPVNFADIVAWLGVKIPIGLKSDLRWTGQGSLADQTHTGTCLIEAFTWKREQGDIAAELVAAYQWPQSASISDLRVKMNQQEIRCDARYSPGSLAVTRLQHRDGDKLTLQGDAAIPLPDDLANIEAFLSQKKPWSINLKSEALPFSTANQWLPADKPLPISGNAKLDLAISGSPADPRITANCELKEVQYLAKKEIAAAELSLQLHGENQSLKLDGRLLTTRTDAAVISASMPFRPQQWRLKPESLKQEILQLKIGIPRLDLARFADLLPDVKDLAGTVSANVNVSGSFSEPQITGEINLDRLAATLPDKKIPPLRDGSARLIFTGKQANLEKLQLSLVGGTLRGSGSADLTNLANPRLDFRLRGEALPLWRDDAVISRADADFALVGLLDAARISGSINIFDSLLYKDFEILPIGKPFSLPQATALPALDARADLVVARMPAPFANWTLDVAVKTTEPFLIRGNLAKGEIHLDCRIGGTLADPKPSGQAEIRDLNAALPLSRLNIESGFIRLSPATGLDPVLDIRGTSRVSNHNIDIYVYGVASAPKILLTSEPPLPDNEIMTLLATGTTTKGLGDGSMAQTRAMQLVLEEFRRGRLPLGNRLAPLLDKLDSVELAVGEPDPYSGKKRASAKMPLRGNWFVTGAVDGEGKTRSLLLFQFKFR